MKRSLLILSSLILSATGFAQNPNACTITPGCTPTAGYCSTPASGSDLAAGDVGVFYSDIVQITAASDFMSIPIDNVVMNLTSAPPGLTIVFTPNTGTETTCDIPGGSSACFTVYGTPTNSGQDQEVVIGAIGTAGGNSIPITLTYLIDINGSASLKETKLAELSVYPNPSSSNVKISVPNATKIVVMDVLGQKVGLYSVTETLEINVSNWKTGVYFIKDEQNGTTVKFIKK